MRQRARALRAGGDTDTDTDSHLAEGTFETAD
jgi:hypothetical protein